MLSLSQTTAYAIMALTTIANSGDTLVLAKDIAERTGIAKPYLSKLLYSLGHSGLIVSKRGYKGGLALARSAEEITLMDIAQAVEGDVMKGRCVLGLPTCSGDSPCPMHEFWLQESYKIESRLRNLTLAQVAIAKKDGWRLDGMKSEHIAINN